MAKTPKNDQQQPQQTPSSLASTPTKTMVSGVGANPQKPHHHHYKTKVPFKKVFSSSHLQTNPNAGQQLPDSTKSTKTRGSVSSIQSFQLLNQHNPHLSSSLPGMFNEIQKQERKLSSQSSSASQQHQQKHNQYPFQQKTLDRMRTYHKPVISESSSTCSTSNNNTKLATTNKYLKNIPIGAIEPSLIGSLSTYLADLENFEAEKFIKEIELMLKYFEDAVKKDKLELLNGSCNILIETIALNCSRLRDAYLHLQQVQLRLQILSNIYNDDDDDNEDQNGQNEQDTSAKSACPIIEATNELNRNLSELVKWSDEIYLRQQVKHLDFFEMDYGEEGEQEEDKIPQELIEEGTQISRRVFISFKNLVKAYKMMEGELRKCYEDYLYNNTKLVELIMAENSNGHNHLSSSDSSEMFQQSLQKMLRRRSITPPPEYCRMDSLQHLRTMGNGSTSTISSTISSVSSNSANCNSSLTSNSSSSSVFRTHRFIPNIISHQAQKMAQHFRLNNSKKDSISGPTSSSLKMNDKSRPQITENQTVLSFLFGISGSGDGTLKRSESASNIHRINHNILLPKCHYDVVPSHPTGSSAAIMNRVNSVDSRHLQENLDPHQRKYSIGNIEETNGASQSENRKKSTGNSLDSSSRNITQSGTLKNITNFNKSSNSETNSPKHQPMMMKNDLNVISSNDDTNQHPPPLPPKTYRQNGTNSSGRSSIASNTSSMSTSSLTSTTSTASSSSVYSHPTNHHHSGHHRSKDSDSGLGSAPQSNSSGEFQKPIASSGYDQSTAQILKTSQDVPQELHEQEIQVALVKDSNSSTYSQVTLRPKKTRNRNNRVIPEDNNNSNNDDNCSVCQNNNNDNDNQSSESPVEHLPRRSSPPPLPPPDPFFSISTSNNDHLNGSPSSQRQSANDQPSRCCCCCCCCNAESSLNQPTSNSSRHQRQIRTYRRPSTGGVVGSGQHPRLSGINSYMEPPSMDRKAQFFRRGSLMHSMSTVMTEDGRCSISPPPLPPKRNLHAYMGFVGNYTGPTGSNNSLDQVRSKSMFCGPVSNQQPTSMSSNTSLTSSTSITTTVSSSSMSTAGGANSPLSSTMVSSEVEDRYQHLPMAPSPPPPPAEKRDPSPPPTLPPRRDKVGDFPPPPPVQRLQHNNSNHNHSHHKICNQQMMPRTSTPINLSQRHHHHHHHCRHNPKIQIDPLKESELESVVDRSDQELFDPQQQQQEKLETEKQIQGIDEEEEEEDEEDSAPEVTCCPFCSEETIHPEEECVLAQVDVAPEMFSLETDSDDQHGSSPQTNTLMPFNEMNILQIRGATIDALLIRATQASLTQDDETFVDCFLSTYRSFITAQQLLIKLTFRYRFFTERSSSASKQTTDIVHQSVARKVVTFITLLIGEIYIYDFDKQLLDTMMEFIYQLVTKGDLVNAKFLREKCYEKLRLKEREFRRQQSRFQQQNNSAGSDGGDNADNTDQQQDRDNTIVDKPNLTMNLKTWSLLDFKAEHLAEQMTLLDSRLFYKIELPEILIWAKEQKEESIPNLSLFTEHFNNMSYWARSQILKCQDQKEREKYMMKFLKIMKYLRKLNNFNSYLAILSALDCAPISRLDWPKNVTDMIREYGSLIDSSSSFRTYRNTLANSKPPCIPYIGLILQDLTFVHIGNSDYLPDGKVNWCKRYKQYTILCQMRQFKQCKYSLNENENILTFFNGFEDYLQEDVMWQISDSLKPRVTSSSNNASILSNQSAVK